MWKRYTGKLYNLKEKIKKCEVTPRRANYYYAGSSIPGAVKMATIWLIPKDAEKPFDRRRKKSGGECDKNCNM